MPNGWPTEASRGAAPRKWTAKKLVVPASSFDRVFSVFGVTLFRDPKQGMREAFRVLRPGGLATITAWTSPVGAGPFILWRDALEATFPTRQARLLPPATARLCDEGPLRQDMEACGFEVVQVVEESAAWRVASVDELLAHVEDIYGPVMHHHDLSTEERAALLGTMRGQLEDRFGSGEVSVPSTAHIIVARKPE